MELGSRTVGILGGMGPLATADLYRKIIEATPAGRDQDHLHVVIDADPKIPDRTDALLGRGPDPLPRMIAAARRLEAAGAGVVLMPCNTAHAFLPALRSRIGIPVLDMVAEGAAEVARDVSRARRVGLLATAGTVMAGLYERALERHDLMTINPDDDCQRLVSEGIAHVKAGSLDEASELFAKVASRLAEAGAEALIAGCSEIPIVFDESKAPLPLIDPTRALAKAAVRWANEPADVTVDATGSWSEAPVQ